MFTQETVSDYELLQQFKDFLKNHLTEVRQYPDLATYVENARSGFFFTPIETTKIPAHYNRVIRQLTPDDYQAISRMIQL